MAGEAENKKKKGGTPVFASPNAFGGKQREFDYFSLARIALFLSLDPLDFYQLLYLPLEDEEKMKKIRRALATFEIFNKTKEMMTHGPKYRQDLSSCKKLKISRGDLVAAGIPENWFLDQIGRSGANTLQHENLAIDLG